jgi:MFS family permease
VLTTVTIHRRHLTRQRVATSVVFVSFGLALGLWAAELPAIKHTIDASSAAMGTVLLILGCGAVFGMQISGHAVDRFGSGRVAITGIAAVASALVLPVVLPTWLKVAIAAFLLGFAMGISEVGVNAAAVEIERLYRRPIMASFHGMFSVGTVIGALFGAATFAAGISPAEAAFVISLVVLAFTAGAAPTLWRQPGRSSSVSATSVGAANSHDSVQRRTFRLTVFGMLAFLLMLTEGCAMDWSSLHTQQHFGWIVEFGRVGPCVLHVGDDCR